MLLLSTSEANGLCLIETAELDGYDRLSIVYEERRITFYSETNLKPREPLIETIALQDDVRKLLNFNGEDLRRNE